MAIPTQQCVPVRWPDGWTDPARLTQLQGTPFNCIVGPNIDTAVRAAGIQILGLNDPQISLVPDAKWPQVQMGENGHAATGPTGVPWVDANGYAIQLARALAPGKAVWLSYAPPKRTLRADDYRLAVCDAAAYGGHWLVPADVPYWTQVVETQRFFSAHPDWQNFRPVARLGIISDFAGPIRFLADETLNLLTRRYVPFAILPKPRAAEVDFNGLHAIAYLDKEPPEGALAAKLAAFEKAGGVVPRIATDDPWHLALDLHNALGRRNDLVRIWNGGSLNVYYTASPDGRTALLQLLNYAARVPGQDVTAGVAITYRSARIYTLEEPAGKPIALQKVRDGLELNLPRFVVCAAIEFER